MIRHIELAFENFDLTCWAEDMEDFEIDTEESIKEEVLQFLYDDPQTVFEHVKIKKIWYEED